MSKKQFESYLQRTHVIEQLLEGPTVLIIIPDVGVLPEFRTGYGAWLQEKPKVAEETQPPLPDIEDPKIVFKAEIVLFRVSAVQVLDLIAIKTEQGRIAVVISKICDILGVAAQDQIEKVRVRKYWRARMVLAHLPGDPRPREVWVLDLEYVPAWLLTIGPTRVKEESQAALIKLQTECSEVLSLHFFPPEPVKEEPKRNDEDFIIKILGVIIPAMTQQVTLAVAPVSAAMQQVAQCISILTRDMHPDPIDPEYMWFDVLVHELNMKHFLGEHNMAAIHGVYSMPYGQPSSVEVGALTSGRLKTLLRLYEPNAWAAYMGKQGEKLTIKKAALPFVLAVCRWWLHTAFSCAMKKGGGSHFTGQGVHKSDYEEIDEIDFYKRYYALGYGSTSALAKADLDRIINTCPRVSRFVPPQQSR